jgi:hypothetical protein
MVCPDPQKHELSSTNSTQRNRRFQRCKDIVIWEEMTNGKCGDNGGIGSAECLEEVSGAV